MSRAEVVEIDCPECGKKQKVTIWRTINVTLDPGLKKKLLEGHINHFECRSCGTRAWLGGQFLLYHDMDRRFMVYCCPPTSLDDPKFLGQFKPDGRMEMPGIPEQMSAQYHMHVVFDMGELVRYVVFRDRLLQLARGR